MLRDFRLLSNVGYLVIVYVTTYIIYLLMCIYSYNTALLFL
jgi:hypothetical protein